MTVNGSRRDFLKCAAIAAGIASDASGQARNNVSAATRATRNSEIVARRKSLGFLRVRVVDGTVHLTAYKTTPEFENKTFRERFRTIRVFRREEPDFAFGRDYAEYFDGLSPGDTAPIFEGPLQAANDRKFTYVDSQVKVGMTYAYWMAAADREPTGPAPVRVRDPEVWWSSDRLNIAMTTLQQRYPGLVTVETIGSTVRGRPIKAICVGKANRCIGMVGLVHAGESGPELMLPPFEHILAEHPGVLSSVSIASVPALNLDERQRLVEGVPWYLRTNANGVDLNRNFPADWSTLEYGYGLDSSDPDSATYRGTSPASEPETKAVMAFLRAKSPEAVYSFHCLAGICGASLLAPKAGAKDAAYATRCRHYAIPYAKGLLPELPEGKILSFGTSAGSLAAWCYHELHIPAYDLEISSLEREAHAKCSTDRTDRALLNEYQRRHVNGILTVLGTMINKKGSPP
jgi:hypothetical protein